MCKKHGKPILPGRIKSGSKNRGCSDCLKECRVKYQSKRAKEFDKMNRKEQPLCAVCKYRAVPKLLYKLHTLICYTCLSRTPKMKRSFRKYYKEHKNEYIARRLKWRRENPERAKELSKWANRSYRKSRYLEEQSIL